MQVNQIYQFVNDATAQALGVDKDGNAVTLLNEDLSNIVDVGNAVFNANAWTAYLEALINRIGRTIFVDRKYPGKSPRVLRDGWEYGSVLQKIAGDLPEAEENETWDLVDGASYDPNIFTKSSVEAKFYNKKVTFQIKLSITKVQLKQSFVSGSEMSRFLDMLYVQVENSMTAKLDELILRTINNMTAETVYSKYGSGAITGAGGPRCINLLYDYNQAHGTSLTVAKALLDIDFLRYATGEIGKYIERLQAMSRVFNEGHKARFTPLEKLHVVLHADFVKDVDTYLQAPTFHNEFNKLPYGDIVPFWQGTGASYAFSDTAKIDVTTADGHSRAVTGILAVLFDHDALGVCNEEARTTSDWNAPAEFWNEWHKKDAQYFNDFNENFVVFFVA